MRKGLLEILSGAGAYGVMLHSYITKDNITWGLGLILTMVMIIYYLRMIVKNENEKD